MLAAEITAKSSVDYERVAREAVRRIATWTRRSASTTGARCRFPGRAFPDIARGVNRALEAREQAGETEAAAALGAGDQGMMFGYSTTETPELMHAPIAEDIAEEVVRPVLVTSVLKRPVRRVRSFWP